MQVLMIFEQRNIDVIENKMVIKKYNTLGCIST